MKAFSYKNLGLAGRLGNQLWEIAWVIGQSAKYDAEGFIPADWSYREFFSVPDVYFRPMPEMAIDGGVDYFQEFHYFEHVQDMVKRYFQPSEAAQAYLQSTYPAWLLDPGIHKTSIHIRRTDYLDNPRHFVRMSDHYYNTAIELIKSSSPDTKFVVFSDDYEFATQYFPDFYVVKGEIVSTVPSERPAVPMDWPDLFLQANCQRHIIANSTYSWWGAFLSDDDAVIYPSKWYGRALRTIPWHRMIPSNWVKVEN